MLDKGVRRQLEEAVAALKSGGIVAFPTETVYGLGADAGNREAVKKIFAIKGRPADHPLIVHIGDAGLLENWARDIPQTAWALAEYFWPGPLTMILRRQSGVLSEVTGGQETVGLRMPSHPIALELLRGFGGGVAAPSANRFGRISPTLAEHVRAELGDRVDLIIDGGSCQVGVESTIVDLTSGTPVVLRPGSVTISTISEVLGKEILVGRKGSSMVRVPGTLDSHYAPDMPLRILPVDLLQLEAIRLSERGLKVALMARSELLLNRSSSGNIGNYKMPSDPEGYAHDLYATLHRISGENFDCILVEALPLDDSWQGIADRLTRAASLLPTA